MWLHPQNHTIIKAERDLPDHAVQPSTQHCQGTPKPHHPVTPTSSLSLTGYPEDSWSWYWRLRQIRHSEPLPFAHPLSLYSAFNNEQDSPSLCFCHQGIYRNFFLLFELQAKPSSSWVFVLLILSLHDLPTPLWSSQIAWPSFHSR